MKKTIYLFALIISIISCSNSADYNKIKETLISVHETDQLYRKQMNPLSKKYGWNSKEVIALIDKVRKQDSINTKIVTNIIDNYGWIGIDDIGEEANKTIFLVIQHSTPEIQEKYLSIMREAVKEGNAKAKNLALLEDRVATNNFEKQIYGSQITSNLKGETFVYPIFDPENVNARRKEVGLVTIEEYLKSFDLTWDIEKHKATSKTRMDEIKEISKLIVK